MGLFKEWKNGRNGKQSPPPPANTPTRTAPDQLAIPSQTAPTQSLVIVPQDLLLIAALTSLGAHPISSANSLKTNTHFQIFELPDTVGMRPGRAARKDEFGDYVDTISITDCVIPASIWAPDGTLLFTVDLMNGTCTPGLSWKDTIEFWVSHEHTGLVFTDEIVYVGGTQKGFVNREIFEQLVSGLTSLGKIDVQRTAERLFQLEVGLTAGKEEFTARIDSLQTTLETIGQQRLEAVQMFLSGLGRTATPAPVALDHL